MRHFTRLAAPPSLTEAAPDATRSYMERKATDLGASFFWPTRNGVSIYKAVRAAAGAQTDEHCSYCDGFPLNVTGRPELDHFKPRDAAPELAYEWTNLYLCCSACNGEKLKRWDAALLRPDASDYSFGAYFRFDTITGALAPHPGASQEDQHRASRTIDLFGLNRDDLRWARKDCPRSRRKYAHAEFAYRFLFLPPL